MYLLSNDDVRRNPYPLYAQLRHSSPVFLEPQSGLWMIFDYDGVRRALTDTAAFSSKHGPDWIIFTDPPRHTKLRAIISKAFTPRSIAGLETRIREISRKLLDATIERGEMDLAADFAIQLPMQVIAEMLGVPAEDRARLKHWNDVIVNMSYTIGRRDQDAYTAMNDFITITGEMKDYLALMLERRRKAPSDDLFTRLLNAEVDGERLTQEEILGFFQGLLVAGSETTTNLINNAILCFIENPDQLERLRQRMDLLPAAIEEVLRYRSPLQWMYRVTTRDVEIGGRTIPARKLVLAVIGSANHDEKYFQNPQRFDIARDPIPHIAFGHGIHFCMGAPLARLEARIALGDLLERVKELRLASDEPWEPRRGLHVHGPARLPIRFEPGKRSMA